MSSHPIAVICAIISMDLKRVSETIFNSVLIQLLEFNVINCVSKYFCFAIHFIANNIENDAKWSRCRKKWPRLSVNSQWISEKCWFDRKVGKINIEIFAYYAIFTFETIFCWYNSDCNLAYTSVKLLRIFKMLFSKWNVVFTKNRSGLLTFSHCAVFSGFVLRKTLCNSFYCFF